MATTPAIQRLLDVPVERFLAEYWPAQPLHAIGPIERLTELATHPAVSDIPSFIRAHSGARQLHVRMPDGTVRHESAGAEEAVAQYHAGLVMDLRDIQRWFPPALAWMTALAAELSAGAGYCHAFISPAGTGVAKHFDNREVFAVQILGRKRWRVARNDAWPMPLMPHAAGGSVHPLNQHAPAAALAELEMPADAVCHVLEPGSVMFVPRGYWHDTDTLEDSLSFSFGVRTASRIETFVDRVTTELAREPGWRRTACDLRTRPAGTEVFVAALQQTLADLRDRSS